MTFANKIPIPLRVKMIDIFSLFFVTTVQRFTYAVHPGKPCPLTAWYRRQLSPLTVLTSC